jgi:hypothetical protein
MDNPLPFSEAYPVLMSQLRTGGGLPTERLGITDMEAFACALIGFIVGAAPLFALIVLFARGLSDWQMYLLLALGVIAWWYCAARVAYAVYCHIFRSKQPAP